jgi:hypothetical protein
MGRSTADVRRSPRKNTTSARKNSSRRSAHTHGLSVFVCRARWCAEDAEGAFVMGCARVQDEDEW